MEHELERMIELLKETERIKNALLKKIAELPDNQNIKRLNHNCFVVNSSEVFKHDHFEPEYYDFRYTYTQLVKHLMNVPTGKVIDELKTILSNKSFRLNNVKLYLHPDSIRDLTAILEGDQNE